MTAAFASSQRQENRAEQLESLRRQMASVSGKVVDRADELLPDSQSRLVVGESDCAVVPQHDSSDEAKPEPVPRCAAAALEPDKPVKDDFTFGFWNLK